MNWAEFAAIAVAHLLAVASPGPDFAIVVRQTLRFGSLAGLWASAGVATGITLHVAYCLFGVAVLITGSPSLFPLFKLAAAALLGFLGVQSLISARDGLRRQADIRSGDVPITTTLPTQTIDATTARRAFTAGFMTNGLNPKATLFFLALFSVVISPSTPFSQQLFYGVYLAGATLLWFSCLSLLIGRASLRQTVQRAAPAIDAVMGLVLLALAIQLALFGAS